MVPKTVVAGELCPTSGFLDHIASILPTADQCPGIPRSAFDKLEISSEARIEKGLMDSIVNLYDRIDGLREDLTIIHNAQD